MSVYRGHHIGHGKPCPYGYNIMTNRSVGLYIHIPFCRKKCLYCDFYSVALCDGFAEKYTEAVKRNLAAYGDIEFSTVYFGGGTPILLAPYLGEMLSAANIANGAEITAECNPCEMTDEALSALLKAGINRISVGVQSLCDNELSALGRRHDSDTALRAIERARAAGFDDISADLMLGIPQQTRESLAKTLDTLTALPITHISAYMLKVEPNTPFGKSAPPLPDEDSVADMYLQTVNTLAKHGFHQYEISNFAVGRCAHTPPQSIDELYSCRHNLKYWRRFASQTAHFPDGQWRREEYLGIGPAAHSFMDGRRFAVARDLDEFLNAPRQIELTTDEAPDEYEERVMLGLRLSEGVPEELCRPFEHALKLIPKNYYRLDGGRLALTAEGFLLSNEIISLLLSHKK